jgi:hypothetical protein
MSFWVNATSRVLQCEQKYLFELPVLLARDRSMIIGSLTSIDYSLDNTAVINFFFSSLLLVLTFSLLALANGLALSRIPQHSQVTLGVIK